MTRKRKTSTTTTTTSRTTTTTTPPATRTRTTTRTTTTTSMTTTTTTSGTTTKRTTTGTTTRTTTKTRTRSATTRRTSEAGPGQPPPRMTVSVPVPLLPRPEWIKARAPLGEGYERLRLLMRDLDLHTVCEEARCPNVGECWNRGTATFMILGDVCTRACGFCAVETGLPGLPPDPEEPRRVADAVARMGLRHAVITSVNRDDQPDGGAFVFAAVVEEIRRRVPGCAVELLIPDLKGDWNALGTILASRPDVLNHNTETVPRLYRHVRPGASFPR